MSHPVSFFLFSALLYCLDRIVNKHGKSLAFLGAICALIIITRPTNLIFVLAAFSMSLSRLSDHPGRLFLLLKRKRLLVFSSISAFMMVFALQLAYWKFATGNWIHYSYEEERFNFFHPELSNGLFSFRKGWFVYSPLALMALLGLIPLYKTNKLEAIIILLCTFTAVYVYFSWHQWYYGGSFGCRVMIEYYALLSIPLAALIDYAIRKGKIARSISAIILGGCLLLNLWQTYQFNIAIIPTDGNTAEYYKRMFFKLERSKEDDKLFSKFN
jgi:hypothetical protein